MFPVNLFSAIALICENIKFNLLLSIAGSVLKSDKIKIFTIYNSDKDQKNNIINAGKPHQAAK